MFAGAEVPEKAGLAFAPFGFGPRNCLGMNLALLEIRVLLPELIRRFEFRLPAEYSGVAADDDDFFMETFLTLRPKDSLPMLLTRRTRLSAEGLGGGGCAAGVGQGTR